MGVPGNNPLYGGMPPQDRINGFAGIKTRAAQFQSYRATGCRSFTAFEFEKQ
jgi:hypothetical protein